MNKLASADAPALEALLPNAQYVMICEGINKCIVSKKQVHPAILSPNPNLPKNHDI